MITKEYDDNGRLVTIKEEGKQTRIIYTETGRLEFQVFVNSYFIITGYDLENNVVLIEDSNGNKITYEYDKNNNLISRKRTYSDKSIYKHDKNNNLISREKTFLDTIKNIFNE